MKASSSKKKHNLHNGIMIALNGTRGAIDLASIMVGIIVIGIIGGVIAATVFAVIPWAQDQAAKKTVDSVHTAESGYRGFSEDKGESKYGNKEELLTFVTEEAPSTGLVEDDPSYQVVAGVTPEGKPCYAAAAISATTHIFVGVNGKPSSVQVENIAQANSYVAAYCPVTFDPFPNGNTPGNTAGDVTATNVVYGDSGSSVTFLDFDANEADLPWTAANGSGYSNTTNAIQVFVGDTEIPLNESSATNAYWEISFWYGEVDLYMGEPISLKNDLEAAGSSIAAFLTDGRVVGTFDGVPNNTINIDVPNNNITGPTPPGWVGNPNEDQPVYQTTTSNNWVQSNLSAYDVSEYGFYGQANNFKVSDNGQNAWVEQHWYNLHRYSHSNNGGTSWSSYSGYPLSGCFEGVPGDNGTNISSYNYHNNIYGGVGEESQAQIVSVSEASSCDNIVLGMTDDGPVNTYGPDPVYSNQVVELQKSYYYGVWASQNTIVGLVGTVDNENPDADGYGTWSYRFNISNNAGASGGMVDVPASWMDEINNGTLGIYLDGTILTVYHGAASNQDFEFYDISGGTLNQFSTLHANGSIGMTYYGEPDISQIAVQASDNLQHFVIGAGDGNLAISHDGGNTFTWVTPAGYESDDDWFTSVDISNNGQRVIAKMGSADAGKRILYGSSNGGSDWADLGAPGSYMQGTAWSADANLNVINYFIPSNSNQTPGSAHWNWGSTNTSTQCIENCQAPGGGGPIAS